MLTFKQFIDEGLWGILPKVKRIACDHHPFGVTHKFEVSHPSLAEPVKISALHLHRDIPDGHGDTHYARGDIHTTIGGDYANKLGPAGVRHAAREIHSHIQNSSQRTLTPVGSFTGLRVTGARARSMRHQRLGFGDDG